MAAHPFYFWEKQRKMMDPIVGPIGLQKRLPDMIEKVHQYRVR